MCSSYIHTDQNDQYIGRSGDHDSHLPTPESIEVSLFKEKVKERVVKETSAIGKIYDNEAALAMVPLAGEAGEYSRRFISRIFIFFAP